MLVPPWRKPDNFSTPAHQRLVDALNAIAFQTGTGDLDTVTTPGGRVVADRRPLIVDEIIFAKVVTAGPNSEADFTDNRYWVKKQDVRTPSTATNATTLADDISPPGDMTTDAGGDVVAASVVMATYPVADDAHALAADSVVLLIAYHTSNRSGGARDKRYLLVPLSAPATLPAGQYDGMVLETNPSLVSAFGFMRLVNTPPV